MNRRKVAVAGAALVMAASLPLAAHAGTTVNHITLATPLDLQRSVIADEASAAALVHLSPSLVWAGRWYAGADGARCFIARNLAGQEVVYRGLLVEPGGVVRFCTAAS